MQTSPATFFLIILPEQYNVPVHTQVACSYKFRYFTRIMQYGYGTESKGAVTGQAHRQNGYIMISVRNMVVRKSGKWPPNH
jgi:hypothetical protein